MAWQPYDYVSPPIQTKLTRADCKANKFELCAFIFDSCHSIGRLLMAYDKLSELES